MTLNSAPLECCPIKPAKYVRVNTGNYERLLSPSDGHLIFRMVADTNIILALKAVQYDCVTSDT